MPLDQEQDGKDTGKMLAPKKASIPKSVTTNFVGSMRLCDLLDKEEGVELQPTEISVEKSRGVMEKSSSVDSKSVEDEFYGAESAIQMAADSSTDLDDRLKAGMDKLKLLAHKGKEEIKERLKKKESNKSDSDKETATQSTSVPAIKLSNLEHDKAEQTVVLKENKPVFRIETPRGDAPSVVPRRPSRTKHEEKKAQGASLLPSKFWTYTISFGICLVGIVPFLPNFVSGFIWGVAFSLAIGGGLYLVFVPRTAKSTYKFEDEGRERTEDGRDSPETEQMFIEQCEVEVESGVVYRGWMNTLPDGKIYRPNEYSVNKTISVLVRLDGPTLRVSKPIHNVLRHACWQDPTLKDKDPRYVGQNLFDLTDAKVCLRPRRLAHRRWWSRKYPICIKLKCANNENKALATSDHEIELNGHGDAVVEEPGVDGLADVGRDADSELTDASDVTSVSSRKKKRSKVKLLYLFARCSREKEMWFHRLRQSACMYSFRKEKLLFAPTAKEANEEVDIRDIVSETPSRSGSLRVMSQTNRKRLDSAESTHSAPLIYDESVESASIEGSLLESEAPEDGWSQVEDVRGLKSTLSAHWMQYATTQNNFLIYMDRILGEEKGQEAKETFPRSTYVSVGSTRVQILDLGSSRWDQTRLRRPIADSTAVSWANAMAARIFYDFTGDQKWVDFVKTRMQGKLSTLRLPHFIEKLHLSRLDPGSDPPKITGAFQHTVNEWGLWMDFKVDYTGGFTLALETKVNLMKLKHGTGPNNMQFETDAMLSPSASDSDIASFVGREPVGSYSDENVPESPESSPDEDSSFIAHIPLLKADSSQPKESKGKKILNFVDKISASKMFQDVTDTKFVKKMMQGISDTPLMLKVEVVYLSGVVTFNVAPPPSDRIWYAFRNPPNVELKVSPKVGQKVIGMTQVTEWIGNKLKQLIEKNLVLPNMDDLTVPVMGGSPLLDKLNN